MRPDGSDVVALPGTPEGFLAAFSPDGRWLLFALQAEPGTLHYRVIVQRPDGSDRRQLGDSLRSNEDPRWTVDGSGVVFTEVAVVERLPSETPREFVQRRRQSQRDLVTTVDGQRTRVLEPGEANRLTRDRGLSPDGTWQLLSRQVGGVTTLYARNVVTGVERVLDEAPRP